MDGADGVGLRIQGLGFRGLRDEGVDGKGLRHCVWGLPV